MIKCQVCQHDNPSEAEYCEDCGAALTASAPQGAPEQQAPAASTPAPEATPMPEAAPSGAVAPPSMHDAAPETPSAPEALDAAQGAPLTAPTPAPEASQAVPSAQAPRLVANRYGAPASEEYPLMADRLVVGRFDPETGPVDIDLSQAPEAGQISRHHAEIYRESDGQWHVKDLGSTNGVFVKTSGSSTFGPRITTPQPVASGDELAFGNARFIFRAD